MEENKVENTTAAIEEVSQPGTGETTPVAEKTPSAPAVEAQTTAGAPETSAPAYEPNWKFKAADKEHEIEEWARPLVKDADTEKKVKALYEKAYGLDQVLSKKEESQKQFTELKTNYENLYTEVAEVMTLKNQGDLGTFFQKVGVSDEQVAKYMLDKINRQNLPPEQQQVYNELDAKRKLEYQQAKQLENLESRNRQMATQAREWELDQWLTKPDVTSMVERYDSVNGRGSFKNSVAEIGIQYHAMYGEDPSVEKAVSIALDNWKKLEAVFRGQQSPGVPSTPQPTNQEKPLPVIPNVSGKNVSPTSKAVRSVDDLRKLSAEANQ